MILQRLSPAQKCSHFLQISADRKVVCNLKDEATARSDLARFSTYGVSSARCCQVMSVCHTWCNQFGHGNFLLSIRINVTNYGLKGKREQWDQQRRFQMLLVLNQPIWKLPQIWATSLVVISSCLLLAQNHFPIRWFQSFGWIHGALCMTMSMHAYLHTMMHPRIRPHVYIMYVCDT
jgi:hypothetical protein